MANETPPNGRPVGNPQLPQQPQEPQPTPTGPSGLYLDPLVKPELTDEAKLA